MKILLVGSIYNQHVMNFAIALNDIGYDIYGFNLSRTILHPQGYNTIPFKKTWSIKPVHRNKIVDIYVKTIGCVKTFLSIKEKFDIVQFHFINIYALPFSVITRNRDQKFSSFVYGSDFLRAGRFGKILLKYTFNFSNKVVCDSTTVKNKLKNSFPNYSDKIECALFGSVVIDELLIKAPIMTRDKHHGKYNVMVGYNGSKAHHHIQIIKCLNNVKDEVNVIVPMTYGATAEYVMEVEDVLKKSSYSYEILKDFMSNDEWESCLIRTDILIHMQDSDAFSSVIAEHLLLGHVVINAEWLDYEDLTISKVFDIKANFENLPEKISTILGQYDKIREKCYSNKDKIVALKGLKYTIANYWKPYFEDLATNAR